MACFFFVCEHYSMVEGVMLGSGLLGVMKSTERPYLKLSALRCGLYIIGPHVNEEV